jgi:DNA-binding transcriptional MerR regulator
MTKLEPEKDKLVPISKAAHILGVSIATVRRWDNQGKLHAIRKGGKQGRYRYFSIAELEDIKLAKPLFISKAAQKLGLSATTLRRLEEQGLISPERNKAGERMYTRECIKEFINSEYLRQCKKKH